jgi:hypothetical protein
MVLAREGSGDPWQWVTPEPGETLEVFEPVRSLRAKGRTLSPEAVEVLRFADRTIMTAVPAAQREQVADAPLLVYRQGATISRVAWPVTLPDFGTIT